MSATIPNFASRLCQPKRARWSSAPPHGRNTDTKPPVLTRQIYAGACDRRLLNRGRRILPGAPTCCASKVKGQR
jgi:hypothetical protein